MTTPPDFDRLSAYLDKQLAPAETAALEQRLAREPELKATLDELRANARLLRSLPVIKPPRNFTLTRAQAPARPRFQLFPVLRLTASLASLAFIFVLAADWWTATQLTASQSAPMQEAMMADVAVTESPPTDEAYSIAATTGGEASPTATPEMLMALLPETPTPEAARYAASEPTPTLEPLPSEDTAAKSAAPPAEAGAPDDRVAWRWAEAGLAVLAGALALWAWLWRKR